MKILPAGRRLAFAFLWTLLFFARASAAPEEKLRQIPDVLKAWEPWALWSDDDRDCPASYQDPKKRFCFWPSRLEIQVQPTGAHFSLGVTVFQETWIAIPGGKEIWPQGVKANGSATPVVEHQGAPAVHLPAGLFRIEGDYRWSDVPQRIAVPREIGILSLAIDAKAVENPVWDAEGFLWLKRDGSTEEADKNFLSLKLYAALEDGIPLWLRTETELTVSGKSREEDLGTILPEGWKLASVESPIPVAVDDAGRMKAQVRAGTWKVHIDAFRLDNPKELRFGANARPAVSEELVAFRSKPDLRIVEIVGPPSIDISQTTFPEKWRELPVYRWDTTTPLQIEERMRGMGQQKPAGLNIAREWWLDENGRGLTFRDHITGEMQQIWRLDAAPGQDLGSVRSSGQGQLITRNPANGASGVEIRSRKLDLEATGRSAQVRTLPAVGWQTDADALKVTLNLPPGWRLFALFGADWVRGDWLTSWTLLDLFLLLIFTLAVFRLWGIGPALLAFAAFGISFHEPGAPRYTWLILLVPLALRKAPLEGWPRRFLCLFKWTAATLLILFLVPFAAHQIQQALYPQLERAGIERTDEVSDFEFTTITGGTPPPPESEAPVERSESSPSLSLFSSVPSRARNAVSKDNLLYDSKARIQTGPGVPEWKWRTVSFGWNGPVLGTQKIRPVLISLGMERLLTVIRVALLLLLAGTLLDARRLGGWVSRGAPKGAAVAILLLALGLAGTASAQTQIPNQPTLDMLRARLLEVSDAFPTAADIPFVALTLNDRRMTMDAEIHTAIRAAAPLPGRLPAWSPLTVLVDDKPEPALRREDGYLWVVLPAGVHHVRVEGMLANVTEWEWTFLLKPHQVKIEAPGWSFTGVRPGGLPEQQVFFALKQRTTAGQASYDRQDVQSIALVDRTIELGLVGRCNTTVTRLSPAGKAVALRIPLLPGENVLSANTVVKDGFIEIGLGAQETTFTWESGIAVTNQLKLATRKDDAWVERWHLVASPVWNVTIASLLPNFEAGNTDLIPVWQPWPGEEADLAVSRPEAIAGATVTVSRATHGITLGQRQRASTLELALRCSLGEDFLVEVPVAAEITSLEQNGKALPVRRDENRLIIPLHPGEQTVSIAWKTNTLLGFRATGEAIHLPVESANIRTSISVPENRWVLWATGPRRGPAVRFWGILICSILAALALERVPRSPLRLVEWVLLAIGLTQVPLPAALAVIGWLFLLAWRGRSGAELTRGRFNLLQLFLVALTAAALCILLVAVGEGLLGNPEMFIAGQGSTQHMLHWFQPRTDGLLPQPKCYSISIWWYRFLMLLWALWLAAALVRWLRWGWQSFSAGGLWKKPDRKIKTPVQPPAIVPASNTPGTPG